MGMKLCDRLESGQPKLTLTTLPSQCHHKAVAEPVGLITPPLHPMASIPFRWEEVPGRPRIKTNKTLSPSQVDKPKSARFLDLPPKMLMLVDSKVTDLPSPRCTGGGGKEIEGSFDFSDLQRKSAPGIEFNVKVKITRLKRRSSLFGFPQILDNIYGSLKQMMCRHNKKRSSKKIVRT